MTSNSETYEETDLSGIILVKTEFQSPKKIENWYKFTKGKKHWFVDDRCEQGDLFIGHSDSDETKRL